MWPYWCMSQKSWLLHVCLVKTLFLTFYAYILLILNTDLLLLSYFFFFFYFTPTIRRGIYFKHRLWHLSSPCVMLSFVISIVPACCVPSSRLCLVNTLISFMSFRTIDTPSFFLPWYTSVPPHISLTLFIKTLLTCLEICGFMSRTAVIRELRFPACVFVRRFY